MQGKAQVRKYATTQGIPRPEATALRLGLVRSKIGLQLPLHAARLDPMLNMDKSNERLDSHDERVVLKRHCYTLLHPIAPVSRFFFRRSSVRAWMFFGKFMRQQAAGAAPAPGPGSLAGASEALGKNHQKTMYEA